MTPRAKKKLDVAASATKWLVLAGTVLALAKGTLDVRATNQQLKVRAAADSTTVAKLRSEVGTLRGRIVALERAAVAPKKKSRKASAASEATTRTNPVMDVLGAGVELAKAPFRLLGWLFIVPEQDQRR